MPFWQIIAIIVVVWILAVLGIIMFMMGAARGRAREKRSDERALQETQQKHRVRGP
ncbi:MAG: hypothetical protein WBX27_06935 [Specibacter sp.]